MLRFITLSRAIALAALAVGVSPAQAAGQQKTYLFLSGRTPAVVDRVEVQLEVGGNLKVTAEDKVKRMKMSVVGNLIYDEKTLEVSPGSGGCLRSVRYYDKATAVLKVEDTQLKPALRDDRRLIGVEIDAPTTTVFSPRGTLTREELDLIDVLGNSLLLDQLLPQGPVAEGDTWKHSEKLMATLLGLDAVGQTDVQSVLSEVTDAAAIFELAGRIEGAVGGVATEIQLKAKYRFVRDSKRIDWLGLLVKEQRSIGHVRPGLDVVARLQVRILPQSGSTRLTDAALDDLPLEPTTRLSRLTYNSSQGDWCFRHDRCWHMTSEDSQLTVLRLIDRGELVEGRAGQSNGTPPVSGQRPAGARQELHEVCPDQAMD